MTEIQKLNTKINKIHSKIDIYNEMMLILKSEMDELNAELKVLNHELDKHEIDRTSSQTCHHCLCSGHKYKYCPVIIQRCKNKMAGRKRDDSWCSGLTYLPPSDDIVPLIYCSTCYSIEHSSKECELRKRIMNRDLSAFKELYGENYEFR